MIRRLLLSLTVLGGILLASPLTAGAFDPFGGVNCSGEASKSAVCNPQNNGGNPLTGSNGALIKVTNIVAFIAGAAAVIIIVVSGIRFMTSGGNSDKASEARKTLTGALIGIAVIVLARTLIVFVVKQL